MEGIKASYEGMHAVYQWGAGFSACQGIQDAGMLHEQSQQDFYKKEALRYGVGGGVLRGSQHRYGYHEPLEKQDRTEPPATGIYLNCTWSWL
ncbi:hypothetical protein D3C76_1722070 [compost metagenome]